MLFLHGCPVFTRIASSNVLGHNRDDHKRLTPQKGTAFDVVPFILAGLVRRISVTIAAFLIVALVAFVLAFQEPRTRRRL